MLITQKVTRQACRRFLLSICQNPVAESPENRNFRGPPRHPRPTNRLIHQGPWIGRHSAWIDSFTPVFTGRKHPRPNGTP